QGFASGVWTRPVRARLNSRLRELANFPIFFVREIPEIDSIVGFELRFAHLRRMKMPFSNNFRAIYGLGLERRRHHVIGMQAQQEIGKYAVVADFLSILIV